MSSLKLTGKNELSAHSEDVKQGYIESAVELDRKKGCGHNEGGRIYKEIRGINW